MNMIIYMSLERGISRRVCRLRMYFFLRFFFVVIISLESLHRVGLYYITLKLQSSINWMAYAQCKTSTQPNSAQHKTIQDKTRLDMIHFIVVCIYVGNCDLCAEWSLQHCVRSITVHSCHLCAECILIIRCVWKKRNSIRIVFGIIRTKSGKTSEDAIKLIYFAEIFPTQFISNALIIRSVSNGFKKIVGNFELHLTFFFQLRWEVHLNLWHKWVSIQTK